MKYIVLLGDGMADFPVPALEGKTPLEVAQIPTFDQLAREGDTGLVHTIPEGYPPGSDVANLCVMGYNPVAFYSGRSPLEAVSIGVPLEDGDITYRMNLVTVDEADTFGQEVMLDHSAGEITTEEADQLVQALNEALPLAGNRIYTGTSYRHCLVVHGGETGADQTPPHDILEQSIGDYLPKGTQASYFTDLMQASMAILKDHPVNQKRIAAGKRPANMAWFWGEGTKPALTPFKELYGKTGGVVSAVDLLKGLGLSAGLEAPEVEGATGTLDTNYEGKLAAALDILKDNDFVYMHFEGPDEAGHHGDPAEKIEAIERLDKRVLKPLMAKLAEAGEDYHILLMPDHATPIVERTHTSNPIPFVLYRSNQAPTHPAQGYSEKMAEETGYLIRHGYELMGMLLADD
ncbi:cofactor-independent phosphoglycerate mutase [Peptococcus simiae]|uniref:cofactor-independent phosphoglycerate mutase n=1 Tax=Peptococcus simiae TaxID=1643805 RepID=UPI00397E9A49